MPNEDQLTRAERIRLESLAQAQSLTGMTATKQPTVDDVLATAERVEAWLKRADMAGDA